MLSLFTSSLIFLGIGLSGNSFAKSCEVYGISDSPQTNKCYFYTTAEMSKLKLLCKDKKYWVEWHDRLHEVKQAYHEEVETGSSPLVFEGSQFQLKTISYRIYSTAALAFEGKTYRGFCLN